MYPIRIVVIAALLVLIIVFLTIMLGATFLTLVVPTIYSKADMIVQLARLLFIGLLLIYINMIVFLRLLKLLEIGNTSLDKIIVKIYMFIALVYSLLQCINVKHLMEVSFEYLE